MNLIESVAATALSHPDRLAHVWRDETLTYADLWAQSARLASALATIERGRPIVVHGHKQGAMLVSFLACVRSGHPYIPVDSATPALRLDAIVDAADVPLVLAVEDLPHDLGRPTWTMSELRHLFGHGDTAAVEPVGPDEPFYVIYTSGSSGTPKGVQISRSAVESFAAWALSLRERPEEHVLYLNQAPFSFDLSVFELAMAWGSGATIMSIDRGQMAQLGVLMSTLAASGVTTWVSTPSFATLCLSDPAFNQAMLPALRLLLFCGETLPHATASELVRRFPQAHVLNTYGPTESTVAVTSVVCDAEVLAQHQVLPVGRAKPGTRLLIRDEAGRPLPGGERGEIVIVGDTVSLGYLGRPDLTASAFDVVEGERAYRTGDAGYLRDGMLFFAGRLDFQVKLHGYRIELEDIEANLQRLPGVVAAVVLPVEAADSPGSVAHLRTFVQLDGPPPERPLLMTTELKRALRALVPDYMVPKVFTYVDALPLTPHGKADRRALKALQ